MNQDKEAAGIRSGLLSLEQEEHNEGLPTDGMKRPLAHDDNSKKAHAKKLKSDVCPVIEKPQEDRILNEDGRVSSFEVQSSDASGGTGENPDWESENEDSHQYQDTDDDDDDYIYENIFEHAAAVQSSTLEDAGQGTREIQVIQTDIPYQYEPLDSPTSIRIVQILPGYPHTPIEIILTRHNLSEMKDCFALSYEWGESSRNHSVFCNGKSLKVTGNLLAFLKQHRSTPLRKPIWIDAISINQDDIDERSQQVPLMATIYREAAWVLAWVGEPGLTITRESVDNVTKLAKTYWTLSSELRDQLGLWYVIKESELPVSARKFLDTFSQDPSRRGTLDLVSRSYFRRLWIIQELVLASRLLFVCGDYHIGPQEVDAAAAMIWYCTFFRNADSGYAPDNFSPARNILAQRLRHSEGSRKIKLLNMTIAAFPEALCSDPRDHIYGLLGLVPMAQAAIVVNYTKSTTQVFREAAEYMLVQEQSTRTWTRLDLQWNLPCIDGPSWVPRYGRSTMFAYLAKSFEASPVQTLKEITIQGDILTIYGSIIDVISDATVNFSSENEEEILVSYAQKVTDEDPSSFKAKLTSFWQSLVIFVPHMDDYMRLERSFTDTISALSERSKPPAIRYHDEYESEFLSKMQFCMRSSRSATNDLGRNLFRCSEGYFGVGPAGKNTAGESAVQKGDFVAIISETFPIILRPVEDGLYTLVGKAHIAYPKGPPWANGRKTLDVVPIRIR